MYLKLLSKEANDLYTVKRWGPILFLHSLLQSTAAIFQTSNFLTGFIILVLVLVYRQAFWFTY
jgi:hypothetical protein